MLFSVRCAAFAMVALTTLSVGCTRQKPDDTRRPVVATYAKLVHATYEDALGDAQELQRAVDALVANPSELDLTQARQRWQAARLTYGYSEAFRFYAGPIDGDGGPEGEMNGWPLDENHVDAVRMDQYNAAPGLNIVGDAKAFPDITPELIAAQNEAGGEKNIASGYHAIEFLLWGQDLNQPPDSAGQRPYTDFVAEGAAAEVNKRRGKYLQAATQLLVRDLESLVGQWRPLQKAEAANYRANLVDGDVYTALKRMITGVATLAEVEMAGERLSVPLLSGDQEEEQSCFSDTTANDLRANAAGIEHVFYALYQRRDGTMVSGASLADLIKATDPRVAEEMEARIARTREALAAIHDPFDREIQPDNKEGQARVQAAVDSLRAESQSFARVAKALQIFLSPMQSEGD
jgi:putative iron-regulated protein